MRRHPFLTLFFVVVVGFIFFVMIAAALFGDDEDGGFFTSPDHVLILKIEGPIFDSLKFIKKLNKIEKDDSVKAIVLRIDSPGGAVSPSQEIFEEVKKLKKNKKIVVSMGKVAASGAYYISLAGDKIFANLGTVTGSIGVIMESFGVEEIVKWAKVESRVVKTGKFKDAGSPFRTMSPDDREYFQALIDNMYLQFRTAIVQQRGLSMEKVTALADGRVYSGEQAKAEGLIDEIGTINDAIMEAKKLAQLPEDALVIWPHEKKSPLSFLFDDEEESASSKDFFTRYIVNNFPFLLYMSQVPDPQ